MLIAMALSSRHIDTVVVLDGKERHCSKRATCERRANAEKDSIKLLVARTKLHALLNDGDNTVEGSKRVHDLQRKIRGLENSLKRRLPSNFNESLKNLVDGYDSNGKGEISIIMAPYQADLCLAKLAVAGNVDAIMSGNSDFCMYVGPNGLNGLEDIMLKDLQLSTTDNSIKKCKVYTGQQHVANQIKAILSMKLGHSPFEKRDNNFKGRTPDYPIFSGIDDPLVRALLAVLVGCDACPGGVKNKGPKAAYELVRKHSKLSGKELHDELAKDISKMTGTFVNDPAVTRQKNWSVEHDGQCMLLTRKMQSYVI
jgi:5'-3' exonuclease